MADVLAICEKETAFVRILADYLKRKYRSQLEIHAFDDVDCLLDLPQEKKFGLCFIGEGMLQAFQLEQLLKRCEHILYFTGKRKKEGVFKFQSVEKVTKDMLDLCLQKGISFFETESLFAENRKVKFIAFYSPIRHILQSSLALTMGQVLARKQKVLYLNFEPYSGFEYMMQKHYEHDLMDIFFFLREEKSKFRLKLESITESVGGLCYIPPVFCYPDMEEIDTAIWQKLLSRMVTETEYDVILLDMTEQTKGVFSILEMCDEIYSFIPDDGLALAKMDQYQRLLLHMKKDQIREHTKTCVLPVFHEIPTQASMFTHSELAKYIKTIMTEEEADESDR